MIVTQAGAFRRFLSLLFIGPFIVSLTGCYTYSTIAREELPARASDSVRVTRVELLGGEVLDLTDAPSPSYGSLATSGVAHRVRQDSIGVIPYATVRSVTIREYDPLLTGLGIGGTALLLGGVVFIVAMATSRWSP